MKLAKTLLIFLIVVMFSSCGIMLELFGELFLGVGEGAAIEGAVLRGAVRGVPRAAALRGVGAVGTETVMSRGVLASEFSSVRLVRSGWGRPKLVVRSNGGKLIERAELISERQIRMLKPPYHVYELPGRIYTIRNHGVWVKKSPNWARDGNILYQAKKDQLVMFYYEKGDWSYIGLPGLMIDGWVLNNQLAKADTTGKLASYNYNIETIQVEPEVKEKFEQLALNLKTLSDFKEYKVIDSRREGKFLLEVLDLVIDSWSEKTLYKLRFEVQFVKQNNNWVLDKILDKQILETKSKWINCPSCKGTGHELEYTNLICQYCWASGKVICRSCGDKVCPNCNGNRGSQCGNCQSGKIPCGNCNKLGYIQYYSYREKCGTCSGMGYYKCNNCSGNGSFKCKNCYGSGKISSVSNVWIYCETCKGTGHIPTQLVCKNCYGNKQIRNEFK
jgi:hypothetical protein